MKLQVSWLAKYLDWIPNNVKNVPQDITFMRQKSTVTGKQKDAITTNKTEKHANPAKLSSSSWTTFAWRTVGRFVPERPLDNW